MTSPRKTPNIWGLAGITYGAVIVVTLLSILAYYYVALPKNTESQLFDATRSMAVGSIWIAVYPGATITDTTSAQHEGTTESTLTFATKDPPESVLSFYAAAMKKGVFRFSTVRKTPDGGTVQSTVHEGKTTVIVTVVASGGSTGGEIRTIDSKDRQP
jgi:hypothetical protein